MTVERYVHSLWKSQDHETFVITMLRSQNMDINLIQDLPSIGFIAYDSDGPIAAGFLRMIEGSYAMFDSYVTNANRDGLTRDFALDLVTSKLLQFSKDVGTRAVMAFSKDPNTIARAERHGLKIFDDHKFQIMDIK